MANFVYRSGAATNDAMTPRPGIDTVSSPGKSAGLSFWTTLESAAKPGAKAQTLDLDRLDPPLRAFPDDPTSGGVEGHVAIAPEDESGSVDEELLAEWASTRGTGRPHKLTGHVLDAIVGQIRRSQ